jgi:hypothetical protein
MDVTAIKRGELGDRPWETNASETAGAYLGLRDRLIGIGICIDRLPDYAENTPKSQKNRV